MKLCHRDGDFGSAGLKIGVVLGGDKKIVIIMLGQLSFSVTRKI